MTSRRRCLTGWKLIRLSGYTEEEKVHIALQHLLPKQMKTNGLKSGELAVTESAIRESSATTREAGVRSLEREDQQDLPQVVKQLLLKKQDRKVQVAAKNLDKFLGVRRYSFAWPRSRTRWARSPDWRGPKSAATC